MVHGQPTGLFVGGQTSCGGDRVDSLEQNPLQPKTPSTLIQPPSGITQKPLQPGGQSTVAPKSAGQTETSINKPLQLQGPPQVPPDCA